MRRTQTRLAYRRFRHSRKPEPELELQQVSPRARRGPRAWSGFPPASSGADRQTRAMRCPCARSKIDGFWIDRTEVTNAQFAEFVRATGYVTVAEKAPDPKQFPDAPAELLVPGSIVYSPPAGRVDLSNPLSWWRYQPGAQLEASGGSFELDRGSREPPGRARLLGRR